MSVSTQIDDCVPIDRDRFHRLMKIELGTAVEYLGKTGPVHGLATVSMTCVPAGIQLELVDAVTRKSARRVIVIAHVAPESRSRLMALTVAEFVFASWLELTLQKRAVLEPEGPPPPVVIERSAAAVVEDRVVAAEAPDTTWQLATALEVLAFTSALRLIPCLALRISHALSRSVALAIAVQVGRANLPGIIDGQPASVELTTTSLLASVAYTEDVGDFQLYAGGGARLGFSYVRGTPPVSRTSSARLDPFGSYAPWAGGAVLVGAVYRAGSHARVTLGIEIGFVTLETVAITDPEPRGSPPVMRLKDAWGGASLGLGWAF